MRVRLFNDQRGDTIMEVLICVAMLGFMLGTAFSLTNKNQLTNRATQERSEATKLAEKQTENLRSHYAKYSKYENNRLADTLGEVFCYNPNATGEVKDIYIEYSDSCKYNPSGSGVEYDIKIHRADTATAASLGSKGASHVVIVTWDDVRGGAKQELKVFYSLDEVSSGLYSNSVAIPTPPPPPPPPPDLCANISGVQNPISSQYYTVGSNCYLHFDITIAPNSFTSCTPMEGPFGDGADGCKTTGAGISSPSMFAWRNYWASYSLTGLPAMEPFSTLNLEIKYRQYGGNAPAGYVFTPWIWSYNSSDYFMFGFIDKVNLPAGAPGEQKIVTKSIPAYATESANTLGVYWDNNQGIDPNLQIDSIRIYR